MSEVRTHGAAGLARSTSDGVPTPRRWLISLVSAALLSVAGVFWVRSYKVSDYFGWHDRNALVLSNGARVLRLRFTVEVAPGGSFIANPGMFHSVEHVDWFRGQFDDVLPRWGVAGLTYKVDRATATVTRVLDVPWWLISAVVAALPAVRVFRAWRGARRIRAGLCVACGYDIRAVSERCSECGNTPATAGEDPSLALESTAIVAVVLLSLLVAKMSGIFNSPPPPDPVANLTARMVTPERVELVWQGPAPLPLGYKVDSAVGGTRRWGGFEKLGPTETQYQKGGLAAGTTYEFRVRSVGVFGEASSVITVTTPAGSDAPTRPDVDSADHAKDREWPLR